MSSVNGYEIFVKIFSGGSKEEVEMRLVDVDFESCDVSWVSAKE